MVNSAESSVPYTHSSRYKDSLHFLYLRLCIEFAFVHRYVKKICECKIIPSFSEGMRKLSHHGFLAKLSKITKRVCITPISQFISPGFFMYIEASWSTPRNSYARLTSPEVGAQRRSSCLEFWYHMYGVDVEELNVYIMASDGPLPSTPAWTQTGDHGDYWHRATVNINMLNRPFKVTPLVL